MLMLKQRGLILAAVCSAVMLQSLSTQAMGGTSETVAYRLTEWVTLHFDESEKAEEHYDTVTTLGCEAEKEEHGGHVDVSYRCPQWRKIELKSHKSAHAWERWLKAAGFETKHQH